MILAVFALITALQIQANTTVWDGVYTSAQAARGRALFTASCSRCHGTDAAGNPDRRLTGDSFMDKWREDTIDLLFNQIKLTMPPNRSSDRPVLSDETYLDLLSFIFEENNFPGGDAELTAESLTSTLMVGKDGPKPLSSYTMVQIVGCLTRVQDVWMLTRSTEPRRSRMPYETSPEELEAAAAEPLGSRNFRLQNIEELDPPSNPARQDGHKMQAKGILNLQPGRERIAVTSVQSLAPDCGP